MSTLKSYTYDLFEKVLGKPISLEESVQVNYFDQMYFLDNATKQRILVVKLSQLIAYKRTFWVYLPEMAMQNWLEVYIKDEAPDGTFRPEKIRYSESKRLETFLSESSQEVYGKVSNQEYAVSLGGKANLESLIQIVMEENYKKGRQI